MRRFASGSVGGIVVGLLLAAPALADHTNPRTPLAPTAGVISPGISRGDGTWQHLGHLQGGANPALTGGGTDLEFFTPLGTKDIYGSFGTLGQDDAGAIGQRIVRLTRGDAVAPTWVADHGSGHCTTSNPSGTTGLQHDTQVATYNNVKLITDTTDATGRCHDPNGGGIEIVDATGIAHPAFNPREAHLIRFDGFSHTHTVDQQRPWIIFNSSSEFSGKNWIDVINARSCFGSVWWTLAQRRAACRPVVHRIQLKPEWTQQRDQNTGQLEPGSATCHDITYSAGRLYCAALNATLILDVTGLVGSNGSVRGTPLTCSVVAGTRTGAQVTDCSGAQAAGAVASGWRFLGTFNHPGRDCGPPGTDVRNCNSNNQVRSDDGVSVSHEADPTPDKRFMFVTDERGGGIVPPGSSCTPGIENPHGNGGAHALDISNPASIKYATTPAGRKSVYISDAVVPAATFCDVHVIEQIPGEQRFVAAYYTQGIKIVDYFVDKQGHLQFREAASFTLPEANTWAAEQFKIVKNRDGTRTYFIAADDIHRGIDVVKWTGRPNPMGAKAPPGSIGAAATNLGLVGIAALLLPAAAVVGRRRRRAARD